MILLVGGLVTIAFNGQAATSRRNREEADKQGKLNLLGTYMSLSEVLYRIEKQDTVLPSDVSHLRQNPPFLIPT